MHDLIFGSEQLFETAEKSRDAEQRDDHCHEHGQGSRETHCIQKWVSCDSQAGERDDNRDAGKDYRASRSCVWHGCRFHAFHALPQILPVSSKDEQSIVDADCESMHVC